jgi:hypothetical protein
MAESLAPEGIGEQLAAEAESQDLLARRHGLPKVFLLGGKPGVLLLVVSSHRSPEADQEVKGADRGEGIPPADQAGEDGMSPCRGPLGEGAGPVERVVLEKKESHGC